MTHEPNVVIVKELSDVEFKGWYKDKHKEFKFMFISLLREYLEMDFKEYFKFKLKFDLEWLINDFCFFTLFSGNDFLPSLNGNFDAQVETYKKEFLWNAEEFIIDEQGVVIWTSAKYMFSYVIS